MRRQLLFLILALIIGASMTLFDIDRTGDDRANPAPNHSDSLTEGSIKAHKTISSHYTSDADSNAGRLQMLNKQVLANDGTTNKALFGYQQGLGLWGTFVAKPGVDVNTNTDLSQFVFNSSQNVFKIVASGTAIIPAAAASSVGSVSVNHGLGYTPAILAFQQSGTSYLALPMTNVIVGGANDGKVSTQIYFSVDNTSVAFAAANSGASPGSGAITVKYYLLQETAN